MAETGHASTNTDPEPHVSVTNPEAHGSNPATISIIYYSMYGHVRALADAIKKSAEESGAVVNCYQVPETLSAEILAKMYAPPRDDSIPTATVESLTNCDGVLFGFPTRFGGMCAQMKAFFDSTGGLWMQGALIGKPAGFFFSTGTLGGGQETTALTAITQLAHHGMIYVPIGYGCHDLMNLDEVHGGSAYGTGTLAGPTGARQPSELELRVAAYQGKSFVGVVQALKRGRNVVS